MSIRCAPDPASSVLASTDDAIYATGSATFDGVPEMTYT